MALAPENFCWAVSIAIRNEYVCKEVESSDTVNESLSLYTHRGLGVTSYFVTKLRNILFLK